MKEKRLFYLDAARGFAILLVILGHIWETERLLPVLIYSFHVPLFFIISGILIAHTHQEQRPMRQIIIARLKSLIIPYLFYELVFTGLFGIRNHFDFGSLHVYDALFLQPLNVPLWFLPTLFFSEVFLIALLKLIKDKRIIAAVCLILYAVPFFVGNTQSPAAVLMRCLSSVGFLAAGYFGSVFVQSKNPPPALLLFAIIASGILAWYNGKVGIYKLTFHNPLFFTVCALAGSFVTVFWLKKYRIRILELAGKYSMTFLGLHIIVLRILQEIFGLRTDTIYGGLIALILICMALAPVCLIIKYLRQKAEQKRALAEIS